MLPAPATRSFPVLPVLVLVASVATSGALVVAASAAEPPLSPSREQLKSATDVALATLRFRESENGSWNGSVLDTALMAWALQESPRHYTVEDGPFVRDALGFLVRAARSDGAVVGSAGHPVLETAVSVLALAGSTVPEHRALAERGRMFLAAEFASGGGSAEDRLSALPFLLQALSPRDPSEASEMVRAGRAAALAALERLETPPTGPELAASRTCGAGGTARLALDLLLLGSTSSEGLRESLKMRAMALAGTCLGTTGGALGPSLAAAEVIAASLSDPALVSLLGVDRVNQWKAALARELIARQRPAGDWVAEGACDWKCSDVAGSALAVRALSLLQP